MSSDNFSQHLFGHWQIGSGFWSLNLDTILVTNIIGALIFYSLYKLAHKKTFLPENKYYLAIDWLAEKIDSIVLIFKKDNLRTKAGAAYILFVLWIFCLNSTSLIPKMAISSFLEFFGLNHFNVVSTSDFNFSYALAVSSLMLVQYFAIKTFTFKKFIFKLMSHPLPHWIFFPINLPINLFSEILVRSFSLGFRLFANMTIGEIGYIIITMYLPFGINYFSNVIWSMMHLIIVPLQVYIFLTISSIYTETTIQDEH